MKRKKSEKKFNFSNITLINSNINFTKKNTLNMILFIKGVRCKDIQSKGVQY